MKKVKIISEGENYTAIDIGEFDKLMGYSYLHPKLHHIVKGKVFIGETVKSSGTEISFQILPPATDIGFLHKHKNHEEIYIFIKGKGQFQVDGNILDVKQGTIIRVSADGSRTWRNNSDAEMIIMVIQSQEGSLDSHFIADGFRTKGEISWKQ
ncbi:MAG: cupin domain-containing protein [Bacteroidales bacterium]|nr:cupin domain-containing protein [Bacteroidales bacterium]